MKSIVWRKNLPELKVWATNKDRKPLIIRGARQVGKSTIVRMLASELMLDLIEIDIERESEVASFFKVKNPSEIISLIGVYSGKSIIPGKSILFLDEIQSKPEIIATLRYFYELMPSLHVICAGSLLEFALEKINFSMPVGRIEYMFMGPLTFSEFLIANGKDKLFKYIQNVDINNNIPPAIHNQLIDLVKTFFIVGGMPEAVVHYVDNNDLIEVDRVKNSILNTYQDDFNKFSYKEISKLKLVFNKIPILVGSKLKYSNISQDIKSNIIAELLNLLELARVINLIYHSSANGVPLGAETNHKIKKLLFLDTGLLTTKLGLSLNNFFDINAFDLINKGAIAEQFIGQHLLYRNRSYEEPQLYYWHREKKSSQAEVDFVINYGPQVVPIEVKAGKTGTLKSLNIFMQEKKLHTAIRFNADQPSIYKDNNGYKLISLPLYMVEQIPRFIE